MTSEITKLPLQIIFVTHKSDAKKESHLGRVGPVQAMDKAQESIVVAARTRFLSHCQVHNIINDDVWHHNIFVNRYWYFIHQ